MKFHQNSKCIFSIPLYIRKRKQVRLVHQHYFDKFLSNFLLTYIAFFVSLLACQVVQSEFVTGFLFEYLLKPVKTSSVHEWDYQDDSYPSLASDPCCFQVSLPSTSWEPTMLKFHFFLSQDITMVQKSKKKLGSVCLLISDLLNNLKKIEIRDFGIRDKM